MPLLVLLACASIDKPSARPDETAVPDTDEDTDDIDDTDEPDSDDTDIIETGDTDTGPPIDPNDRDADGVGPADGDCDDDDARVYPGAADPCDAVDQDCDGVAQPEGSCSDLVMLDAANGGAWVGDVPGSTLALWEADTDYDGDGVVDILTYEQCTSWDGSTWCNQNVVLLPGRVPEGEEVVPVAGAPFWIADPSHDWTADFGTAGDFDGDGSTDLFIAARGCKPDDGSLYLMLGPSTRWPTAGATTRTAADGWWEQAEAYDCFADEASGGYDADGDGLDDLLVVGAQVAFVSGRNTPLSGGMPIRDETWFEGEDLYYGFALLPDMDGDGLGEAAVQYLETANHMAFLSSSTLQDGSAGLALAEAADVADLGTYTWLDLFDGRSDLGDVDGDGLPDVAIAATRRAAESTESFEMCSAILFGSLDLRLGDLDEHIDRLVCTYASESSSGGADRITDDVDGDGIPDVLLNTPFGAGARREWLGCIIASSQRPETGWEMLDDVRPYCFDVDGERGMAGAVLDLDGDGLPEILGTDLYYNGDRGRIVVAPGFDIPFGDDSRW